MLRVVSSAISVVCQISKICCKRRGGYFISNILREHVGLTGDSRSCYPTPIIWYRLVGMTGIHMNPEESLPQSGYMACGSSNAVLPWYQKHLTSSNTDRVLLLRYAEHDKFFDATGVRSMELFCNGYLGIVWLQFGPAAFPSSDAGCPKACFSAFGDNVALKLRQHSDELK
jgi:hypothetical protein